ncbi:glycosyltransferase family 2 protein [Lentithecium fluviatile CBS 122367]|uniref:dolichyl-phosphate beta-glucosyltransferase n=1 Tax=Lentithecium fluviatile CBS 122367 TaxID=1168545 RepID=A0A6G1IEW7_9PLEO|nr:glycosyltransferase family 2 protein [Lentithecium fluviatile CBS 122367]
MEKPHTFDTYKRPGVPNPPTWVLVAMLGLLGGALVFWLYIALNLVAPVPRPPRRSEKQYITILPNGDRSSRKELPCWIDKWSAEKEAAKKKAGPGQVVVPPQMPIEDAEIFMSVVVPAFNEEDRLVGMLEEAVEYLLKEFGGAHEGLQEKGSPKKKQKGWEIVIVSDGSTDKTVEKALEFAREHQLSQHKTPASGPWEGGLTHAAEHIPHGSIRVVALEENRGKGGAVTHGMRHVRGQYVVFADADGASRFSDLGKLVEGCKSIEDKEGRGVAIGSRAHLVGSEAVVKRSKLRNFLMHSFHLLLRLLTPPATSRIADTQCGFKLFSRPSLPHIIPYMHSEGWIFDVEMLMLAESADIAMVEVAIGWKEVVGSKLNVVWDSIGMAWGLAVLRAAWMAGVYRKD